MTSSTKKRIAQIRQGQVPKGYKKTRKGTIPIQWKIYTIGDIATISSGSTPSRSVSKYWNGKVPWVTTGELNEGCIRSTKEMISYKAIEDLNLKIYPIGTLLMAMYGQGKTRGTTAVLGINATINQACAAITVRYDLSPYLYYYLQSSYYDMRRLSNVGNQENLNADIIKTYPVILPPLAEQRKIAQILATQDRVIELKKKLLEETKRRKKALVKMLMDPTGRKRLEAASPRDPTKRLESASPRGEAASCRLNNEWHTAHVSDLFVPIARKNTTGNKNILTISAQDGLVNQFEYYKHQYASVDVSGYTLLKRGEFAYNKSRSGEYPYGAIKKLDKYEEGVVSPLYLCFAAKNVACLDFWSYYFEAGMLNRSLYRIAQEGARNHGLLNIPTDGFFESKLLVPPLPVQRRIATILSAADREIDLLRQNLEQEERKKKALMQLLLTGMVRVAGKGGTVENRLPAACESGVKRQEAASPRR